MPQIGMRTIKSAIAVFLCFLIDLLRGKTGMPFYSAVAAILCMQPYVKNSKKIAWNRMTGTIIGGLSGMFVLILECNFFPFHSELLRYLLISFMIIPVITITVWMDKTSASYISCVVFLSVTVSHAADINPFLFPIHRMLDTFIGIFVSFFVNFFHFSFPKNQSHLFVIDADQFFSNTNDPLPTSLQIRLNRLIDHGAQITFLTKHTPAAIATKLSPLHLTLPIIVMRGSACYSLEKQIYTNCMPFSRKQTEQLLDCIHQHFFHCFTYAIVHHVLHVYYEEFTNPVEQKLYYAMRGCALKNYVFGTLPENYSATCLVCIQKTDDIITLRQDLTQSPFIDWIQMIEQPIKDHPDYTYFEIYPVWVSKEHAIQQLKVHSTFSQASIFPNKTEQNPNQILKKIKQIYQQKPTPPLS